MEKGWIGCVGRRTEGEVVEDRMAVDGKEVADVDPHTMSRSLLVQTDFASIGTVLADQELARATKCRQLLALWRAAKARYPVGVGAM